MSSNSYYELLGGEKAIRALVDRFYDLMVELPEAKETLALHPKDLTSSRNKLFKFLSGFLGGPNLYIEEYGHPRLRARHLPFAIGDRERDQWMFCMSKAVDELVEDKLVATQLKSAFQGTADFMRNK